ncbi:MAG TPA: thymidylate kinase [Patescibacteria group bacterium]|nr:thymidylate kinase [Patescibacteria group bacterium]
MNNSKSFFGKLIVIDGTDGSGKKTQTELLYKELTTHKLPVKSISFPQYGQSSAKLIEAYLAGELEVTNPYAAATLYAYDRFAAKNQIKEWLSEGYIVLADRYTLSNCAHQGGKIPALEDRIKFVKWVENLEYGIFEIPRPDLSIILHVPAEISYELVKKNAHKTGAAKDIHEDDIIHLKNAELVYMQLAKIMPRTSIIHCVQDGTLLSIQEIQNKIWQIIYRYVLKNMIM